MASSSHQFNNTTGDENVSNVPGSPSREHNTVLSPMRDNTITTAPESDIRDDQETSVSSEEEDVEVLTDRRTGKRPQPTQEIPVDNAGQ
ncbi:hypothetical protein L195_g058849, partial [Trifolium pratense]